MPERQIAAFLFYEECKSWISHGIDAKQRHVCRGRVTPPSGDIQPMRISEPRSPHAQLSGQRIHLGNKSLHGIPGLPPRSKDAVAYVMSEGLSGRII